MRSREGADRPHAGTHPNKTLRLKRFERKPPSENSRQDSRCRLPPAAPMRKRLSSDRYTSNEA